MCRVFPDYALWLIGNLPRGPVHSGLCNKPNVPGSIQHRVDGGPPYGKSVNKAGAKVYMRRGLFVGSQGRKYEGGAQMNTLSIVLCIIGAGLVCGVIALFIGVSAGRRKAETTLGSAEEQAKHILSEAMKVAEDKKKEAVLEAKEETHRLRAECDRDLRDRRSEQQRLENRVVKKEEMLDRKIENMEAREEKLTGRAKEIDLRLDEVEKLKNQEFLTLEKISGFSVEQAKSFLLGNLENELTHEKALKIREYEQLLREESDQKARELISQAIQRCAADHSSESTVSVVVLPNDEMKGRIIGREGRNIRTLESLTGVDLIIDDMPEAITVSAFDPVRRAVATLALEKLMLDGRIHPARIEEMVEKARREIDQIIKQQGERAVLDAGVHNVHPELVKLLGKLHYRTSYGQNVLNHSLEVCHLSGLMASELGADVQLACRAGLLHDIGKALDHEMEGSHIQLGVDAAKRYRENPIVVHAIQAHHGEVECVNAIDCLVAAADAISAARPGARRENLENYIKRLEKLEEIANSFAGIENSFAIQAGREVRIVVKPEQVTDDQMALVARGIAKRIEEELTYPGQIKVHVVRESRAIEFAK